MSNSDIIHSIVRERAETLMSKEYREWAKANRVSSRIESSSIREWRRRYTQWLSS